ncbi:MAG: EthD family reductase [Anaerolineae bacterium]|nr:EthD family reductase [Anaerolineae bacterium]MDW8172691.1 EthD family reductase [Anaerolineae bacterium]
MIKMVALVKKLPHLSREEFIQRWVEDHTKLSKVLGMKGYRINVALEPQPGGHVPPYDGTAEIWWESVEFMQAALASPENDIAAKDTERFCEVLHFVYTEEFVIV